MAVGRSMSFMLEIECPSEQPNVVWVGEQRFTFVVLCLEVADFDAGSGSWWSILRLPEACAQVPRLNSYYGLQ
jgi:hypothetical protein